MQTKEDNKISLLMEQQTSLSIINLWCTIFYCLTANPSRIKTLVRKKTMKHTHVYLLNWYACPLNYPCALALLNSEGLVVPSAGMPSTQQSQQLQPPGTSVCLSCWIKILLWGDFTRKQKNKQKSCLELKEYLSRLALSSLNWTHWLWQNCILEEWAIRSI